MPIHPLKTTEKIRVSYLNYLKTIKPFQDEDLRQEFAQAIEAQDMLVKGPMLQIALPYQKSVSIHGLVNEGVLSPRFEVLCSDALDYDRPLYAHQVKAIRKAVRGRNIVVSTGTGSGKTETFLIPILDSLLREEEVGTLSQPGVRALLLYPMNALVNDQIKRLRGVLKSYPNIKFGRYINVKETPRTKEEAEKRFNEIYGDEPNIPNELKSREEMHESPPHLLITNYAMLEYLLLRPVASPLFDGEKGDHWRFIILDEAHVYDGANATEMAMLLRRVQDRVAGEKHGKIQAIATSATLGSGVDDYPKVVEFASHLFNKSFVWNSENEEEQDVVGAEWLPISALGETWGGLTPKDYSALFSAIDHNDAVTVADLKGTLADSTVPEGVLQNAENQANRSIDYKVQTFLYEVLRGDENIRKLIQVLQDESKLLHDAAESVFPGYADNEQAIVDLVNLAVMAKTGENEMPLLPARYHTFARALEGAFVCLNEKDHPADKPRLFLQRQKFCPHCHSRVFELANCTSCGTAYLIGKEEFGSALDEQPEGFDIQPNNQYLIQDSRIGGEAATQTSYYVFSGHQSEDDEDQLVASELDIETNTQHEGLEEVQICPKCGQVQPVNLSRKCTCDVPLLKLYNVDLKRKRTLRRCVSCSTRSSGGVVYRFLTGQDAPVSVIAGSLYDELQPAKGKKYLDLPGNGRKMLNFTDSRQNAAFFAPYLERAHMRNFRRGLILKTIKDLLVNGEQDIRLQDLIAPMVNEAEERDLFKNGLSPREKDKQMAIWLMQDFTPIDRRLSLEGLGLLAFDPIADGDWPLPAFLSDPPLSLDRKGAYQLLRFLLNTLRMQGAVSYLLPDQNIYKDHAFEPRNLIFYFRQTSADSKKHIFSWMPSGGYDNARSDYLKRVLREKGVEERELNGKVREILKNCWDYLTDPTLEWHKIFDFVDHPYKSDGKVWQISHRGWRVRLTDDDLSEWKICDRCMNIYPAGVGEACMTYFCQGHLHPLETELATLETNLYRQNYRDNSLIPLSAEEHTAQWTAEKGAEIQADFIEGKINVLSCSTTFELGVDVGDLQAVLMRNMPPTTANYIQRAGRAGRRTDTAAYIMTFAQRRSHDLTHYEDPSRMVSGQLNPPRTPLTNEKILRRHLHSVVFAKFFIWAKEKYQKDFKNVGDFFFPDEGPDGCTLLEEFLSERSPDLAKQIENIIPENMKMYFGLENWKWIDHLINSDKNGVLDLAYEDVNADIDFLKTEVDRLWDEAHQKHDYRYSKVAQGKEKVINQIRDRRLLGFLGSRNVLPKYGFPVDVVELQTNHLESTPEATQVELSRDLRVAISEFAPGSQVVAAKKVWTGRGIKKHRTKEWETIEYKICSNCQNFYMGNSLPTTCRCGETLANARKFIVPETGFIASIEVGEPGEQPPQRTYASRTFFADYEEELAQKYEEKSEYDLVTNLNLTTTIRYSKFGWMVLVNHGFRDGFRVCQTCGYGEVIDFMARGARNHENPITGQDCNGVMRTFDLGHRYLTDVLEIQIDGIPPSFRSRNAMRSLLYAILEGASESLGIRRNDFDGTLYYRGRDQSPSIILYDTVPAGAGHVENIKSNLRKAMEAGLAKVAGCQCGEDTSCYNCLRNYQNQYYHDDLQRGYAVKLLRLLLGNGLD